MNYINGLSGIKNIGNTCYMNSIIQCIGSLNMFRSWLITEQFKTTLENNKSVELSNVIREQRNIPDTEDVSIPKTLVDKACIQTVTYRLAELLKIMWGTNRTVAPNSLKKIIDEYTSMFIGHQQQDSREFLNFIFEQIHADLEVPVNVIFQNVPEEIIEFHKIKTEYDTIIKSENITKEYKAYLVAKYNEYISQHRANSIIYDAYKYWKKYVADSHSIITDLFTGLLFTYIQCSECSNITYAFEPFTMLSIPIDNGLVTTLEECLTNFSKVELLNGDNAYSCEVCKKKVNAIKEIKIWETPNILIIHFKRFEHNNDGITKIDTDVVYPINNFDLSTYMTPLNNSKTKYDLCAINEHIGSYHGGHYASYCINPMDNNWYEYDDASINKKTIKALSNTPYLLFYVRQI